MDWFKRNPIFFSILALLGIAFVAELVLLVKERRNIEETRRIYEDKVEEYERLRNHDPSLTRENLELARQDLEHVEENLETIRAALGAEVDVADLFADKPADTTEAFFDLTSFVDEYREKAAAQVEGEEGIGIRDGEYFGFSRYRNTGPPEPLIEPVYKQRRIAGYLLDTLFDARPVELVNIRRGDVASGRDVSVPSGGEDDVFTIPAGMSARIPDFVETYPFQITFHGYTWTLRAFLNKLASFEMPILVRGVEVSPAGEDQSGERRDRRRPQAARDDREEEEQSGPVPIVEPRLSRFMITVEFIELVSQEGGEG